MEIQRQRKLRGQEPIDVAYKIGVNPRTYERWEAAEREPQLRNLKALAKAWDVEIKDLRPDLEAEDRQLDRIEAGVNRLLDHFDLAELEDIAGGDDRAHDPAPRRTGERPG